ncbi:MAG TPA: hypothetical protein VGL99_15330 [Chloroflexota bacterium]
MLTTHFKPTPEAVAGEPARRVRAILADPDLVVHISEAAPGHGLLNLDVFFEVCSKLAKTLAVIVEHLPADQARAAIAFVKRAAA